MRKSQKPWTRLCGPTGQGGLPESCRIAEVAQSVRQGQDCPPRMFLYESLERFVVRKRVEGSSLTRTLAQRDVLSVLPALRRRLHPRPRQEVRNVRSREKLPFVSGIHPQRAAKGHVFPLCAAC